MNIKKIDKDDTILVENLFKDLYFLGPVDNAEELFKQAEDFTSNEI